MDVVYSLFFGLQCVTSSVLFRREELNDDFSIPKHQVRDRGEPGQNHLEPTTSQCLEYCDDEGAQFRFSDPSIGNGSEIGGY